MRSKSCSRAGSRTSMPSWRLSGPPSASPSWPPAPGPDSRPPTSTWRSRSTASTSRCRSRPARTACSGSDRGGRQPFPISDRALLAVGLLIAGPGLLVEGAHVGVDLVDDLVGQPRGTEALGQRLDGEVPRLQGVDAHGLGNLGDVVEG